MSEDIRPEDIRPEHVGSPEDVGPATSVPQRSSFKTCWRCRHPKQAHQHYRPGTDCGLCDCTAYTGPVRDWITRHTR